MRTPHHPAWVVLAAASCFGVALSGTVRSQAPSDTRDKAASARPISFDVDIRPILAESCFACHGPDEKQRKAKLHFDTRDGAFSRPSVIVPGNTDKSRLIQRITNDDPDEHMPPPDSGTRSRHARLRSSPGGLPKAPNGTCIGRTSRPRARKCPPSSSRDG